ELGSLTTWIGLKAPALKSVCEKLKIVIPRALPEGPCVPQLHDGPRQNTRSLVAEATRDDAVFVLSVVHTHPLSRAFRTYALDWASHRNRVAIMRLTMFGPDGRYGFVCSSFTPELAVVDVKSHQVIKRGEQASPFCPNIAVSPENDEIWTTLKDAGKVQVYNAQPPFEQKALLDTGPITNHVNFVNNRNGKFV